MQRLYSFWFNYAGFMQSDLNVRGRANREAYLGHEFEFQNMTIDGGFRPIPNVTFRFNTTFGGRIDYSNARLGSRFNFNPRFNIEMGLHLSMSLDHVYEKMTVNSAELYTANISQAAIVYQFNSKTFIRSIMQYVDYSYNVDNYTFAVDSEYKNFFSQLLFSYKFNPQTVLFLGYSDNYYGNQNFGISQADRTFFMKIGYAWML